METSSSSLSLPPSVSTSRKAATRPSGKAPPPGLDAAQIPDDRDHARNGPYNSADVCRVLQAAQPRLEPGVVLRRQSEHLADDRERQVSAELGDEIGLVAFP